jgi:hypothetical protein
VCAGGRDHAEPQTYHAPRSCERDVIAGACFSPLLCSDRPDRGCTGRSKARPDLLTSWAGLRLYAVGRVLDGRMAAVPVMKWHDFLDAYPRSHLVVAWLHGRYRTGTVRRARFDLLRRVATALEPRGDWAITDANPQEIYIAYEKAADATQLCTLVRAKPLSPSLQWLSQAAFRFEKPAQRSIVDALKA